MERRMMRRSTSVRAMSRCKIPAPKSKPSSTTYIASITATRQNQIVSMSASSPSLHCALIWQGGRWPRRFLTGTALNLEVDKIEKENRENGIGAEESQQR